MPGGLATARLVEGAGSVVMKNGKPVGAESSGKVVVTLASRTLAAICIVLLVRPERGK